MLVKDIVKKTLLAIQRDGSAATPDIYSKTFCKIAKQEKLNLEECYPAKRFFAKLDKQKKEEAKRKEVTTLDDLIIFLINSYNRDLKALETKNRAPVGSNGLSTAKIYGSVIKEALTPSITKELDKEIVSVSKRLNKNIAAPGGKLIDDLHTLIYQRIEKDRFEVIKKAGDVENSVDDILDSINLIIQSGQVKNKSVKEIQDQLSEINKEKVSSDNFDSIKEKLSIVATSLNSELFSMISELKTKKSEIESLKDIIAKLQADLKKAEEESKTDFLTGVLTKRGLDEQLQRLESDFTRQKRDYAVVFFDIDHFKRVNDNYGHDVGDMILKGFSQSIVSKCRKSDVIGRFGGEEFVAVLPGLAKEEVIGFGEKVRKIIENGVFEYKKKNIKITVSGGIAHRSENDGIRMTIKSADEKLYTSKNSGRNRITH